MEQSTLCVLQNGSPCYHILHSMRTTPEPLLKLENLDEMDKFLERYHVPKLNQDQINDLNSPIFPKDIEAAINSLPSKKPRTRWV